jgi:histidinol dehydrogenase
MEYAGTVENHRGREDGLIVYPVYSRRSRGLSIGVNLYPDKKCCNFDCGYCEVFPFSGSVKFSIALMESGLRKAIAGAVAESVPVKDICFSGNGEPTLSPDFAEALLAAAAIREDAAHCHAVRCHAAHCHAARDNAPAKSSLVVISNGTGLLREDCFAFLENSVRPPVSAELWLKLDAGGADWYKKIDGGAIDFDRLTGAIKKFSENSAFVIQTMHCAVNGAPPPIRELRAWAELTAYIAKSGNVRLVQIYGKARPSPHDPVCAALPLASLEKRAEALKTAFKESGITDVPIAVYE